MQYKPYKALQKTTQHETNNNTNTNTNINAKLWNPMQDYNNCYDG